MAASAPQPAGPGGDRGGRFVGRRDAVGAELEREGAAGVLRLHTDHPAARRAHDLHGEQPEQPEADHDHALAQGRVRSPHPLQGDRAEGRECRVAQGDALRHGRREVSRNAHELGVVSVACAGAGDGLAGGELGQAARVEDDAGARVAERRIARRGAARHVDRLANPVLAGVGQGGAHELGVAQRAHRQRAAASARRHRGAFRARRDHRRRVGDQQPARARARGRHLGDDRRAGA